MFGKVTRTRLSQHINRSCRSNVPVTTQISRNVHVEAKIESLGLKLPEPAVPKGKFVNFLVVNNIAYLSGHLPQPIEGSMVIGKVGKDLSVEQGYEAAKYCGLNLCATLKENIGDLDKVKRLIKVQGFVNCVDGFTEQPGVINGCSELMTKVFGDKGIHTRSALGTNSLPLGVAVEIEAIFELERDWNTSI